MVNKFTRAPAPVPALKGSAPPRESSYQLTPERIAYWASFPKWTWVEALALICGLDPDYARETWSLYSSPRKHLPSNLQAAYDDARRLIERAMPARWCMGGATPAEWLDLAKKHSLSIPPELETEVVKRSGVSGFAELPSDDEVRALIRKIMGENGGYIGQESGAKIVRQTYPNFNKKRAMSLVKELTGNNKPGPKGPRNNRAPNHA